MPVEMPVESPLDLPGVERGVGRGPGWRAGTVGLTGLEGLGGVALIGGCALLAARPVLLRATSAREGMLVAVFSLVGLVGAWWALPAEHPQNGPGGATAGLVLAAGVGAFAAGRLIGGGHSPGALTMHLVVLNSLAAVAEEAFFRRFTYAVLRPGGVVWATSGSAVLFSLVHLTTYGAWVLPIDVAAGLVLGWQRWATGSWRVPALTHALANLFVVL